MPFNPNLGITHTALRFQLTLTEYHQQSQRLTSMGIVSPGNTNTESPTLISSVGTSTQIVSAQSTLSVDGEPSDEIITSLDWVDISDWKKKSCTIKQLKLQQNITLWTEKCHSLG